MWSDEASSVIPFKTNTKSVVQNNAPKPRPVLNGASGFSYNPSFDTYVDTLHEAAAKQLAEDEARRQAIELPEPPPEV